MASFAGSPPAEAGQARHSDILQQRPATEPSLIANLLFSRTIQEREDASSGKSIAAIEIEHVSQHPRCRKNQHRPIHRALGHRGHARFQATLFASLPSRLTAG